MKEIDFIPDWYKATLKRKRSYYRQYVLLTVLFAMMMVWSFVIGRHVTSVQAEVEDLRLASDTAKVRVDKALLLESEIAELQDQSTILETITPRTNLSAILAELSYLAGDNVMLSNLAIEKEELKAVEKQQKTAAANQVVKIGDDANMKQQQLVAGLPSRKKVVLTGIAASPADAARMLARLENSVYFEEVAPVFSKAKKIKDHGVTEFEIRCYVADYKQVK
jgi:hypothetical protein